MKTIRIQNKDDYKVLTIYSEFIDENLNYTQFANLLEKMEIITINNTYEFDNNVTEVKFQLFGSLSIADIKKILKRLGLNV